jgi:hypothetical protein
MLMHLRYIGFLLVIFSSIDSIVGGFGDEISGEANTKIDYQAGK